MTPSRRLFTPSVPAAALCGAILHAGAVAAAPDDGFALSDDAALMGGAVIASGRDAASGWYNPALLGSNRRNHIDVSATVYGLRRTRASAGAVELVGNERRSLEAVDQQLVVVPTAFAVATALRRNVTLGFGFYTSRSYEPDLRVEGRGVNAAGQYSYLHQSRLIGVSRRHHAGPMIGWSPVRGFQVGLSVHGIYDKHERMSRVFANASAFEGVESTTWARNEDSELRSFGGQAVLGVRGELGRWLQAGAVLRTPAMAVHQVVSGSQSLVVASVDALGETDNRADLRTDPAPPRPRSLAPWTVATGLSVGNERWRLGLDAEAMAALRDPFGELHQKPAWNLRLGGRVRVSKRWTLGAGAFTDRSVVPAADIGETDVDLWGASFGVQFLSPVRLARSESARNLAFRTTVAARYAGGVGRLGQLQLRYPDSGASDFAASAEGLTRATVHFANLYVGTGLVF
jgi:hypothetical protein